MGAIELVITDLDGTLWSGHEILHPDTVAAWRELERRGIEVMVATGRRVAATRDPLARVGLAPAAVVMNGALVLHLASGERLHRHCHEPVAARAILDAFHDAGIEPCVYVDDPACAVLVGPEASTHPAHLAALRPQARVVELADHVETATVLMFGVVGHGSTESLEGLAAALAGVAEVHVAPGDQWGGTSCTVTPAGLSKWVGVLRYCERHGIDPARTLAVGDGPNDVELLTGASVAVAPADAQPAALGIADHVVRSTRDGGWATIVEFV